MTPATMHSMLHLLHEVQRLLGARELHIQAWDCATDVHATLLAEGASITNGPEGMQASLSTGGLMLDVFAPPQAARVAGGSSAELVQLLDVEQP